MKKQLEELHNKQQVYLSRFNNMSLSPGGLTELDYIDIEKILSKENTLGLHFFAKDNMKIADVGCWTGSSTVLMGNLVKNTNSKVYAIDWFKGSNEGNMIFCGKFFNIKEILKDNISFWDLNNTVEIIESLSHLAAERFENNSLDFVFIDANHSFDYCIRDISYWFPKVRPYGVIAGHDFENFITNLDEYSIPEPEGTGMHTGVIKAVQTYFKRNNHEVKKVPKTGDSFSSVWYVRKKEK